MFVCEVPHTPAGPGTCRWVTLHAGACVTNWQVTKHKKNANTHFRIQMRAPITSFVISAEPDCARCDSARSNPTIAPGHHAPLVHDLQFVTSSFPYAINPIPSPTNGSRSGAVKAVVPPRQPYKAATLTKCLLTSICHANASSNRTGHPQDCETQAAQTRHQTVLSTEPAPTCQRLIRPHMQH
jgi:hypothetical protein